MFRLILLALASFAMVAQDTTEGILPAGCTPQRISPGSQIWGCVEWLQSSYISLATQKEVADLTKRVEELEKLLGSFIRGSTGRTNSSIKDIGDQKTKRIKEMKLK